MTFEEITNNIIKSVPTYENGQMEPEEFDKLNHNRFNINNFVMPNYEFKNYYVFKIMDTSSSTGYYGMCINKEFYKKVKEANDLWQSRQ